MSVSVHGRELSGFCDWLLVKRERAFGEDLCRMRRSDEQITVGFARPDACGLIHSLYRCQKIDEGFPECVAEVVFHGHLHVTTDTIGSKTESIRVYPLCPTYPVVTSIEKYLGCLCRVLRVVFQDPRPRRNPRVTIFWTRLG